jgi:hypothetical protein
MRRLFVWLGLLVLLLSAATLGTWSAFARSSDLFAAAPALSTASNGIPSSLDGVPLRQNWWATTPDIDPATKLSRTLLSQFSTEGANSQIGFMVYLKAQADTSNSISDWNAKGEYVLRQLERVANATQPSLMQAISSEQASSNVTGVT